MLSRIAAAYFGGSVGALANSLAVWLLAEAQLLAAIGVTIHPRFTWAWLSHRLLWGSLWGLGYPLVASFQKTAWKAGLLLSLAPSLAQLFYFSPRMGAGMGGLASGMLTPLVVLLANALWGIVLARVVASATH